MHNAANFPRCHPAFQQLQELRHERDGYLAAAEAQQVALWEVDEAAKAVSLGMPFTAEQISIYRDWTLPLALVFMTGLFTWGMAGERPEFEVDEGVKLEQKAKRFIQAYKAEAKRKPTQKLLMQKVGVTQAVARKLLKAA